MAETLDAALRALFGESVGGAPSPALAGETTVPAASAAPSAVGSATGATIADLASEASAHYERARAAQRNDDWSTYGAEMKKLGDVLRQLEARQSGRPPR